MRDVYIVEALRFGDRESHSYIVGVFNSKEVAEYAAKVEECWRGGKYECQVDKFEIVSRPNKKKANFYKQCVTGVVSE